MAASAGAGGLSAFGWVVVAGGVAVAGAAGLYFSGVLTPEPEVEKVAVTEPEPVPAPAKPAESAQNEAEAPATEQAADPEPAPATTETVEAKPEPQAAEPESGPVAESSAPQEDAAPAADETLGTEPDVAAAPQAETESAAPVLAAPALDTIRIEPDGSAVLAGKAAPGSALSVRLDGAEIERTQVDRSGAFALFLTLPFSDAPRGLSLVAELEGQTAQSDDYLLSALPKPQPVQLVEATPDADPEAQQAVVDTVSEIQQPEADLGKEPTPQMSQVGNQVVSPATTVHEAVEDEAQEAPTEVVNNKTVAADSAEAETVDNETASALSDPVEEAPRAVAILKSDEEGVELVQAPTQAEPAAKAQIALDTIGYSDTGDVQLTGRATQGALVRVYLNNLAVSDVITDTDGRWRGELEGVSPGIYTLRVDELGPGDVVLSRLETPFKREAPEVLAPKEPEPDIAPDRPAIRAVTVQKGDTLWAISRERYGDGVLFVKVFEANRNAIRNPDLIYPGQVFNIPE